jgi:hypothetical protein
VADDCDEDFDLVWEMSEVVPNIVGSSHPTHLLFAKRRMNVFERHLQFHGDTQIELSCGEKLFVFDPNKNTGRVSPKL